MPDVCSQTASQTVTVNPIPSAPTGSASQSFYSGNSPTVDSLKATGIAIQWYADSIGGIPLAPTDVLNGAHYYASQTLSGCESTSRLDVTVTVFQFPVEVEIQAFVPGEKSVKIYPNPNNGQFILELTNVESGATVCIYNLLGARIYHTTAKNMSSHKINLPGIKKGIYFVIVTDQQEQFTRKMVVN
jgi:hypothetical protein